MSVKARLSLISAATALVLTVAACGGSTTPSQSTPSPSPAPTIQPTVQKVSANTASEDEIEAALRSAGVSNSARWAEEVVEYRPYPTDDPNLTKLRQNLAKYNPGQASVDKIVSVLTP